MALGKIRSANYAGINTPLFDAITTSAAATATITGTLPGVDRFTSVELFITVTATSGDIPTLDVYVQKLCADGTNWTDLVHFGQYTTSNATETCTIISQVAAPYAITDATLGAGLVKTDHIGDTWRIKYVTGGTAPVYTFKLWGNFYE